MKFVFFVFFPVSDNGENGLGDEGADGAMSPQNFWARTAPASHFNNVTGPSSSPLTLGFSPLSSPYNSIYSSHLFYTRQLLYLQ